MNKDDKSPFRKGVLEGRVALVTGGGSGIGLEISRQLGLHGARVVISGRRKPVLENACSLLANQGISTHYVQVRIGHAQDMYLNVNVLPVSGVFSTSDCYCPR